MLINPIILACRPAHRAGTSILDGGKSKTNLTDTKWPRQRDEMRNRNNGKSKGKKEQKRKEKSKEKESVEIPPDSLRYQSGASLYSVGNSLFYPSSFRIGIQPSSPGGLPIFLVKMSPATSDIYF
ncbi:hypothetical protein N7471_001598 [Penicillium samsonianum]|uniref:uncharacterized protein n=1 Tax=Penicillium samsonianum TaxID=1882272 RepID=UPI0025492531|nr:uncharacterized protein N7471_001598 [Penicillium samsonianum]KAJ6150399.1 hypothetical protein N7471_001598 [Penicillium samsonianum]